MLQTLRSENQNYINQHFSKLPGKEATFFIQTFGAFDNHRDHPLHRHSFVEFCYILSGSAVYSEGETDHQIVSDTLLMTPPGTWHKLSSTHGIQVIWLGFNVIEAESTAYGIHAYERLRTSPVRIVSNCGNTLSARLWKMLYEQAASPFVLGAEIFGHLIHALFAALCDQFTRPEDNRSFEENNRPKRSSSILLHQARQFIRDNLSQELHLNTVAEYLHVSGRHLSRIFTSDLGISFSRYLREEKIRRAVHLLTESPMSIKEISNEVGCDTVQYFTKIFSKEMGISPGRYREEVASQATEPVFLQ
ncbi:helix-turn-helix domain-containing protein [Cohnella soli]|uniref:Helix-turn-helix domain-containing protein n=1 Tax=Cohnella soli TaxID=425005 RepID=A0ABW0HLX6_9BACL